MVRSPQYSIKIIPKSKGSTGNETTQRYEKQFHIILDEFHCTKISTRSTWLVEKIASKFHSF
jgi:hypothetical protein